MRILRRFKPQVVLSVFGNDGSGGHGQHQAAGHTAFLAFARSAEALPALDESGETAAPWKAQALFRAAWFAPESATVSRPLGAIDPWSGLSTVQLAMRSRSQHRSQDMGRLLDLGPRDGKYTFVEGPGGAAGNDLFAGIDTSLAGIAATLGVDAARRRRVAGVESAAAEIGAARGRLRPGAGRHRWRRSRALSRRSTGRAPACARARCPGPAPVAELLAEKIAVGEQALLIASGVALDVFVDQAELVPGEPVKLTVALWNAGPSAVKPLGLETAGELGRTLPAAAACRRQLAAHSEVAAGRARPLRADPRRCASRTRARHRPYFLELPRRDDLYDWSAPRRPSAASRSARRCSPAGSPSRSAAARCAWIARRSTATPTRRAARSAGRSSSCRASSSASRPSRGLAERRPGAGDRRRARLACRGAARRRAHLPWRLRRRGRRDDPVPDRRSARQREPPRPGAGLPGDGRAASRSRSPRPPAPSARAPPRRFSTIRTCARRRRYAAAARELVRSDMRLPALSRVGYVLGASDRVPESLVEIGVPVVRLVAADLENGDLARFDAIVVGSRAYETDRALQNANGRLLDYVRGGGLLIVQYQQYAFVEGRFAPLPLEIARPHDRITDEGAPVSLLDPTSPVFRYPNPVGPADWEGWVQERALYMAGSWDPGYRPLLEMSDADQPAQRGGLLVAGLGKGTYVYTGLAFFRQLPAGVPGAFRLFANLLGLRDAAGPSADVRRPSSTGAPASSRDAPRSSTPTSTFPTA